MKLTKISLGVFAACGIIATPAFAIPASSYSNTDELTGSTLNIRVSGATAQDPGLLAAALRFCAAGTMHRYSVANNFVYFCQPNAANFTVPVTTPAKTQLAIYKYSVGGSDAGVSLVNSATNLGFISLASVASSCSPVAVATAGGATQITVDVDGAGPLSSYIDITCAGSVTPVGTVPSYVGISDVEPSFFGSSFPNLTSTGLATVIFGVPVTKNIYSKLQTAQGLGTGLDEANMPSLSQAQVTSIYTQAGLTWDEIGISSAGLDDPTIYVARRVDTSGTQKTFEALIARTTNGTVGAKSCQSNVDAFVQPDSGTTTGDANSLCNTPASIIFSGSGSSNVTACLTNHNAAVGTGGAGTARAAVGILTTETKPSASTGWYFVKINGLAPTQAQVAGGRYTAYADASLNSRITLKPTAAQLGHSEYITRLKTNLADPTIISIINGTAAPYGSAGLMAINALLTPIPAPNFTGATPANPWSRLVGGSDLNNCQPGKLAR